MKLCKDILRKARPYLKNGVRNPEFQPGDLNITLKNAGMFGFGADNDFTVEELNRILRCRA